MPSFEEFVQTELPKRPFTDADGTSGQVLCRSGNPLHPLELVWCDLPGVVSPTTYTAGANLSGHRMVLLDASRNAIYADNATGTHAAQVLGMTKGAATLGTQVEVLRNVEVLEPTWSWIHGGAIYLGANGLLTQTPPTSPAVFSLCVGFATASNRMFVSIGTPIFLA